MEVDQINSSSLADKAKQEEDQDSEVEEELKEMQKSKF